MAKLWGIWLGTLACGCDNPCVGRSPTELTVELTGDREWEPGTYTIRALGRFTQVGGLNAQCVVDIPYAEGDVVFCSSNADVVVTPQRVEQMTANLGGSASYRVTILRGPDVWAESEVSTSVQTTEEVDALCEQSPPTTLSVEVGS